MELEVREVTGEEKAKLGHRLRAYKNEMQRFEQDLVSNEWKTNKYLDVKEGQLPSADSQLTLAKIGCFPDSWRTVFKHSANSCRLSDE